jgi:hypothetical protein
MAKRRWLLTAAYIEEYVEHPEEVMRARYADHLVVVYGNHFFGPLRWRTQIQDAGMLIAEAYPHKSKHKDEWILRTLVRTPTTSTAKLLPPPPDGGQGEQLITCDEMAAALYKYLPGLWQQALLDIAYHPSALGSILDNVLVELARLRTPRTAEERIADVFES